MWDFMINPLSQLLFTFPSRYLLTSLAKRKMATSFEGGPSILDLYRPLLDFVSLVATTCCYDKGGLPQYEENDQQDCLRFSYFCLDVIIVLYPLPLATVRCLPFARY